MAVDEAHLLPPRLLQELRFLLNYQLDSTAPVALVLCGHTELRHKLALRPLDAIRQRVTVAYHLAPLTAAEVGPYVAHQLQQVGVDGRCSPTTPCRPAGNGPGACPGGSTPRRGPA